MNNKILEAVTAAYLEAVIFTDLGPDSEIPADAEFSSSALERARNDCREFLSQFESLALDYVNADKTWDAFGHDFWFTRNRHGVGFWDRGLGRLGDQLTAAAQSFGEIWTVQGDDGFVYLEG